MGKLKNLSEILANEKIKTANLENELIGWLRSILHYEIPDGIRKNIRKRIKELEHGKNKD